MKSVNFLHLSCSKVKFIVMKIFKGIAIFFTSCVLLLLVFYIVADEPIPKGDVSKEADELAKAMMASVNTQAWDSTGAVSWTFRNPHYHTWDRKRNFASISWDDKEVLIDIDGRRGFINKGADGLSELEKSALCESAWKFWVNDSFWLNPISKVFDGGTERRLVKSDEWGEALLVTYKSGGATPGDSYLWILDENKRPKAWKLWVSIIPIGGLKFSWEDWVTLSTGASIATSHKGLLDIPITDVKGTSDLLELTDGIDLFSVLETDNSNLIAF
jgi:hypothetical protein